MEVRGEAGKKASHPVPSAGVHRSLILGALWGVSDTGEWNPGDLCNFYSVKYWLWATPKGWAFPGEEAPVNKVIPWRRCEPSAENSHRGWELAPGL